MSYMSPNIQSYSREQIREHVVASATCAVAVCGTGQSYTCGTGYNYVHSQPDEII